MDYDTIKKLEITSSKLAFLFNQAFGGRDRGKFRIRYDRLSQISGINIITDDTASALVDIAQDYNLALFRDSYGFTVYDLHSIHLSRTVPKGLVDDLDRMITNKNFKILGRKDRQEDEEDY